MARQAYALDTYVREINDHAPTRSKASDGGRGDSAHASRKSDHNPNSAGVWRAYDITHDPTHGMNCAALAESLVRLFGRHPAMGPGSYIIWRRRIISYDRIKEGWRTYTGANPHDKHLHLSVSISRAGYDSRKPWNLWAKAPVKVTRVQQARVLLEEAVKRSGPIRARAIRAALKLLPQK